MHRISSLYLFGFEKADITPKLPPVNYYYTAFLLDNVRGKTNITSAFREHG
jgi:hypothetical protein